MVINGDADDDDDHDFEEVEYVSSGGGGKRKKRGKGRSKRKKNKGQKKWKKIGKKAMYGVGMMKLLLDHFILKKMLFLTIASFILSKTSFLISALLALKHYLSHQQGHSERSENHKLQVVHIPIKSSKHKYSDYFGDESQINSQFVPITTPTATASDFSESELFNFYDQSINPHDGSNNNLADFQPDFQDNKNINYFKFI